MQKVLFSRASRLPPRFKTTYPNDEAENFATAPFRQAATTALDLNKKEMLCMTAFVIDDNCVDSMYIRTA